MPRGPKKHLKRLNAPKHWMLSKLGGVWATRPSHGPHKLRESLPLVIILRNRLKYALSRREVGYILMQRLIKVDHKVRSDPKFPCGFMDVITINKTNENFRLLYDTKGRYIIHRISASEAKFKLCKVKRVQLGQKGIPLLVTHDGRTIRYPNPSIKINDTIKLNLETNKILDFVPNQVGTIAMVTGGRNLGRVGVIISHDRHEGSFDIIQLQDAKGQKFATRSTNVFIIGQGTPLVSLPPRRGIKLSVIEERDRNEKKIEAEKIARSKPKKKKVIRKLKPSLKKSKATAKKVAPKKKN
eukprot:TRINITY_DN242_c0_g3_i2.p1 TRINITY_DN242_c0_g3~~TRINITY_DN242_c0_g3_i2.p1  ORF type:complete len:298 (+),score=143.01 TRINITY_DN242_c0_g3_i2:243-1136(+)